MLLAPGYVSTSKLNLNRKPTRTAKQGKIEKSLGMDNDTAYAPTSWSFKAYANIFEKFNYADPVKHDPEAWNIAKELAYLEYAYMRGSKHTPFPLTAKNPDSTPGIPAMFEYDCEKDMVECEGLDCYHHALEELDNGKLDFLWYGFLKNEVIKREKVEKEDIRLICCAPAVYCRIGAYFEQEMNNRMKERCYEREAKVGWSPFGSDFNELMDEMNQNHEFMELDFTRYDGTIPDFVWSEVNNIRLSCYSGDHKNAYVNYRSNLHHRKMVLATGDMVVIDRGNPSGQYSTSPDNCIAHTLICAYLFTMWWKECSGEYPSIEDLNGFYRLFSYGDDHLSGFNLENKWAVETPKKDWMILNAKEHLGMWIKPENIKTSKTLVGLTFCGLTIIRKGKRWVGRYKADKIFASIVDPAQKVETLEDMGAKISSALLLTVHDNSHFSREILEIADRFQHLKPDWDRPTVGDLKAIWEGPK